MTNSLEILLILGGIFFFYSLIVAQITEMISGLFSIRAKFLAKGIQHLLGKNLGEKLISHPLIQSITFTRIKIPSYIPDYLFTRTLIHLIYKKKSQKSEELISEIPPQVEAILENHPTVEDLALESRVSKWFNDAMERLSGAYKRYIQKVTIGIAFILVVFTNADSLQMIQKVWSDSSLKTMALNSVQEQLTRCEVKDQKIICSKIETDFIPDLISFWSLKEVRQMNWKEGLLKFLGFILTTLGVTLGAPFWFDLLTRLAPGIRMGGSQVRNNQP